MTDPRVTPEVRAYITSALKEIEWQVSTDLGSAWLAGEIVNHRHFTHALDALPDVQR